MNPETFPKATAKLSIQLGVKCISDALVPFQKCSISALSQNASATWFVFKMATGIGWGARFYQEGSNRVPNGELQCF